MNRTKLIALALFFIPALSLYAAGDKPAYCLFDREGNPVTYADMLSASAKQEVVLFGELHNNPIAHWLQFELSRDLHAMFDSSLVLGAEMFESDDQIILDEYLGGQILERHFTAEAKLWNNYQTDYRPLVELARENGLGFIATNIPRRYAAMVHRGGFDALEDLDGQGRSYMAPLPIPYDPELPGYKAMLDMEGLPAHAGENFPKAQAIKDATMGHFIMQHLRPEGLFIHFNGAYHSNNYEGIVWYLREYSENDLAILTISTVEQDDPSHLMDEYLGLADFIIVVPSSMTKTY